MANIRYTACKIFTSFLYMMATRYCSVFSLLKYDMDESFVCRPLAGGCGTSDGMEVRS